MLACCTQSHAAHANKVQPIVVVAANAYMVAVYGIMNYLNYSVVAFTVRPFSQLKSGGV